MLPQAGLVMLAGGLNDLDLYLVPQGWDNLQEDAVARSVAGDDSVEHIFKSVSFGMYEIVVQHFGGIDTDQDYGLAWWMGTDTGATTAGDFDNDGDVDGKDFLAWQRGDSPSQFSSGDLSAWQAGYGSPLSAVTAVPEPNSLLIALLLCGVMIRRRR